MMEDDELEYRITLKGVIASHVIDVLKDQMEAEGYSPEQVWQGVESVVESASDVLVNYTLPYLLVGNNDPERIVSTFIEGFSTMVTPDGPTGDQWFGDLCIGVLSALYEFCGLETPRTEITVMTSSGVMDLRLGFDD